MDLVNLHLNPMNFMKIDGLIWIKLQLQMVHFISNSGVIHKHEHEYTFQTLSSFIWINMVIVSCQNRKKRKYVRE